MASKASVEQTKLRVAIIGAGPAGLGAAIALSELPKVEVSLYEAATQLREIGAGIRIGYNAWKVLGLLGAADGVKGHRKTSVYHRNGLTAEIVAATTESPLPPNQQPHRVRRTRLQSALFVKLPPGVLHLNKRLASLKRISSGGTLLTFNDSTEVHADLVVGADGIRSVVRSSMFPGHAIAFTGTTIWRTLIPLSRVSHLSDVKSTTTWWHGRTEHIYTSPVDDPSELGEDERMLEISCRSLVDPASDTRERVSWGVPASNERVVSHFTDFDPQVRDALAQVQEGEWREFAAFAGPRLEYLVAENSVLLGDASHPLSGAFGSGAAFALEDGWILARAIEYSGTSVRSLPEALAIFNQIRSPYYLRMYQYLDEQKQLAQTQKLANPGNEFEAGLKLKAESLGGESKLPWIYMNDIEDVWKRYLATRRQYSPVNGINTRVGNGEIAVGA